MTENIDPSVNPIQGHMHHSSGAARPAREFNEIVGLHRAERQNMEVFSGEVQAATASIDAQKEIFGDYCNINQYIAAPLEDVYHYAADIYSLQEWTYSMRELKPDPMQQGMYIATEKLAPNTKIWARVEANAETHVVDYLCAWDQGQELWMRYYMRFVDAEPTMRKPGTILMWLNCKHPFYSKGNMDVPDYIRAGQARTDRPWVGDFWPLFKAGHDFEAINLKLITEHLYGHKLAK